MQVGFIGLGTMGAHMAANLQKAAFKLVVHDLRRQYAERHLRAGATWADTPKALAEQCDVIFTSLPGPKEVEAVAASADGLLAGMKPGAVHLDLSTNSPTVIRKLAELYAAKGVHLLDAPVSGGPKGAETRRMALYVGGDEAIFKRVKPMLDAMGDSARYVGKVGDGSVAKLVHNAAGYGVQAVLAEVMTMGIKAGADPVALWQAVRTGALGRARTFDRLADQFLSGTYDPPAFTLRLGTKDMTLATDLAREIGVPVRMLTTAHAEMVEAMNRGWSEQDSRSPMKLQIERAGIGEIKGDPARIKKVLDDDPPFKG